MPAALVTLAFVLQPAPAPLPAGVQWFAQWDAAKAEAVRTGKPILLVSAAPHCSGVSGIW